MTDKEKVQGFDLSDKTALLIGIGGLGCNIAVHLAGAGIGKLYLCDFDVVSASNLNRQFLYTTEDIGKSKASAAKEKLKSYAPETDFVIINKKLEKYEDIAFCGDTDIVIAAADNPEAREAAEIFCRKTRIPLVCGVIDGFYGMCYLYIPEVSPCLHCASMTEKSKAASNISSTAGIIGSLQASTAIKYLLTCDSSLSGKLTVFDESNFECLAVRKSAECKICN